MRQEATVMDPVDVLVRDLRKSAIDLGKDEARFLVDSYYQMQDDRKRSDNQLRSIYDTEEPHQILGWLATQNRRMENQIKAALDIYSDNHPAGQWARSQMGIGPVITAGLLAHIDIRKAPTVGHIWNFAGLNPGVTWEKGKRRPWNAELKTLCWKIGESFVKVSGKEDAYYGQVYKSRKESESFRNEKGEFKEQAAQILIDRNIGKDTDAYKAYIKGKLPPAHIHARAKRLAVKLFLSHFHHVWYELEYGQSPPQPYAIAILGHAHYLKPPGWRG